MGAHRAWVHDAYGTTGQRGALAGGLAAVVQRIDFGPTGSGGGPGGLAGGGTVWRLGSLRAELLALLGERLRFVCAQAGLWRACQPDHLQLTKMDAGQVLANHFERRDAWRDGIASVCWSELPSESDLRGDEWTLVMEKGRGKDQVSATR